MEENPLFWAKTTESGEPGISVENHLRIVGHVARLISRQYSNVVKRLGLSENLIGALAALHDIGKISPGFQRKCERWLEILELVDIDRSWNWKAEMEPDHGKVTHSFVQGMLKNYGFSRKSSSFLATILGGHHGRLNKPNERGFYPDRRIEENVSGIEWNQFRDDIGNHIWNSFTTEQFTQEFNEKSLSLWWIAGLTTVADWIGSDNNFFPSDYDPEIQDIKSASEKAINSIGRFAAKVNGGHVFEEIFGFPPNDLQKSSVQAINGPGVYVIEAPMGIGKTEAALGVAYNLISDNKANGIYFALPTQVTSNRIHIRMNEFLNKISNTDANSRIIHGNSWLFDDSPKVLPADTLHGPSSSDDDRSGRDWFSSLKRALLAPFGVGTIDQALLGVVAAKHFFVRHFALAGKVVILDELHSYDLYTGTLIDKLIETLEGLGCTVIILSATLTAKRRCQLLKIADQNDESYPLITGKRENLPIPSLPIAPPPDRDVKILFEDNEEATSQAISLASGGGTVLWICNTVDNAQNRYELILEKAGAQFPVGLLHSRFPFWRREELENEWMLRLGKTGENRCGSILVATQVVEQSVDLDADLMISELAPTDMMLQRIGRLWRHERAARPIKEPRLTILKESQELEKLKALPSSDIIDILGKKTFVYSPFVLLRTLEVWNSRKTVSIPSDIRNLLEETYKQKEDDPIAWQELQDELLGGDFARKMKANRSANLWQAALEDEEGIQTRLNEVESVTVVLCKELTEDRLVLIDEFQAVLEKNRFIFKTAQTIHRNLVRVPEYHFEAFRSDPSLSQYLKGKYAVGIIGKEGDVIVNGLKAGVRIRYSSNTGLKIEKS